MVSSRVTSPESIEDIVHRLLELGIDLRHSTALITRPSSPAPVATATIATANRKSITKLYAIWCLTPHYHTR